MNKQEKLSEFEEKFPEKTKMCLVDGCRLDTCCIDEGLYENCVNAYKGMKKEDCEYWDDVSIKYQPMEKIRSFISNLIDEAEAEKKDYVIEILNKLSNIITFVEQKTEIDQGINIGLMGVIFSIEDIKKEIKECE